MLLRERETPEGLLVSVCDADCLGETFAHDRGELEVTEAFYGGADAEEAGADRVVASLRRAKTANLVGEESVGVAVEAGLVDENRVLELDGTRHAQLVQM
jgi:hypothetical protein